MRRRHTPPAPLERGDLGYSFGKLVVARKYLSGFRGHFDFRKLCADVTHLLLLSRGEIGMLVSCW